MWLKRLFSDGPVDFEKRCRNRIWCSVGFIILGLAALALVIVSGGEFPVMYLEKESGRFIPQFYLGLGCAFVASGIITIIRNVLYLKDDSLKKKRALEETDERNRLLGLRTWAYSGYSMFLILYLALLISGFVSMAALKAILAVLGVYGLNLLVFRLLLSKLM